MSIRLVIVLPIIFMFEQCIKRNQLDALWTKGHLSLKHNSLNTNSNNNSGPEPDAIAKFFKKIIGFPNRIFVRPKRFGIAPTLFGQFFAGDKRNPQS